LAPGPRDMMKLVYRSVTIRGFVMGEFMHEAERARADLKRWMVEGRLKYRVDTRTGFLTLPHAFMSLFRGENTGMLIVESTGSGESCRSASALLDQLARR
ncbi:MAG TPA: hypothetical protein VFQ61_16440, partial [Polyangiaceae bacterium]|nr:hypothetical protein [Polyangiaceae bacterium]